MRLGRLVVVGLAAGALAGFLVGLIRPRHRGMLPGLRSADLDEGVAGGPFERHAEAQAPGEGAGR
jgi:hypothetical protein